MLGWLVRFDLITEPEVGARGEALRKAAVELTLALQP